MANQGILAQSKPAANTDTLLYSAPVDKSASTVLNVANDGTGSTFDVAGRVFANKPAPDNLEVPRHMYLSDTKLVIGQDEDGEA